MLFIVYEVYGYSMENVWERILFNWSVKMEINIHKGVHRILPRGDKQIFYPPVSETYETYYQFKLYYKGLVINGTVWDSFELSWYLARN